MLLRMNTIVGDAGDPAMAARLHTLEHRGRLETITLAGDDMLRRRLRVATDHGSDCAIALDREAALFDGAVLCLDEDRAVVVRAAPQHWLTVEATDADAAIELGYTAGNMHWRVQFAGRGRLAIALSGPAADYRARLGPLLEGGRVRVIDQHG